MIAYFDCKTYKISLAKYPRPYTTNQITPHQAKKWAKHHFEQYKKYVEEQEEINNKDPHRLKTKVEHAKENTKPDIYI